MPTGKSHACSKESQGHRPEQKRNSCRCGKGGKPGMYLSIRPAARVTFPTVTTNAHEFVIRSDGKNSIQ